MSMCYSGLVRYAVLALLAGCAYDPAGVDEGSSDDGQPVTTDAAVPGTPDAEQPGPGEPDAAPVEPAPDAARACGAGYTPDLGNGSRYRVIMGGKAWAEAEADCEADGAGAHLVVIDDELELAAMDQLATAGEVWVGVSDRRGEGVWLSVTNDGAPFLPWEDGEPNDLFGEDCAELVGDVFNDESCDDKNAYVCECDGQTVDPTAF